MNKLNKKPSLSSFRASTPTSRSSLLTSPRWKKLEPGIYVKRVLYWMRNRKLSSEDAFYELASGIVDEERGRNGEGVTINFIDFEKILKRIEIKIARTFV